MDIDSKTFEEISGNIISSHCFESVLNRTFRGLYGVTANIASLIWKRLYSALASRALPRYLLWTLLFLKGYYTEVFNSTFVQINPKTYRKWIWIIIDALSKKNWYSRGDRLSNISCFGAYISVNCTDFRILEPKPLSPRWYSHKFNRPGLRYEVGIFLKHGTLVWAHGPCECKTYNDLSIFILKLKSMLNEGEYVVADRGYLESKSLTPNSEPVEVSMLNNQFRARHETFNGHLKQFQALSLPFRRGVENTKWCFLLLLMLSTLWSFTLIRFLK